MDTEKTIPEMTKNRVKRYGGKLLFQHKEGWSWKQITWLDFDKSVKDIASFLMGLGFSTGSSALIVSGIRTESIYSEFAIYLLGGIAIPIKENEDLEKIIKIARDSKSRFMFVSKESILDKLRNQVNEIPTLQKIITFSDMSIGEEGRVIPFKGVLKFGSMKKKMIEDELVRKAKGVSPGETAAIFYSFKSDEEIERKEIVHENLIEALRDSSERLSFITEEDQAFSHLSSVSPYERFINYLGIYMGSRISIAETRDEFFDDVLEIKPTVLYETKKSIESLCSKLISTPQKGSPGKKLKDALGGRIRHVLIDSLPRREIINLLSSSGVSLTEVSVLAGL
jgi:long-subunit acyl-CoA synthetase (AMP-forming)